MSDTILDVRELQVHYFTVEGELRACNRVSFTLDKGERLGLVGESGSGKSTAVLALLRLVMPPGKIVGGQAILDGVDLLALPEDQVRAMRGAEITMIPQAAMNSLNPVMRIRDQMGDTITAHERNVSRAEVNERIGDLLERVGLSREVAQMYPHELSGGMKQRVCIANAISLHPQVIIADEPTSALDVVVQRQVMETLGSIQKDLDAAVIFVGHDMGIMAQFVDKIGILYAGRLMELGSVLDIFENPLHPYTRLLISTLPSLDTKGVFKGIPGITPSLIDPPKGCAFHPRCPYADEDCEKKYNYDLRQVSPGRFVACHKIAGGAE